MASSTVHISRARSAQAALRHELDLVESTVALVAHGGARRATLVLMHASQILSDAQAVARDHGVVARAIWRADGACDLVVEPVA